MRNILFLLLFTCGICFSQNCDCSELLKYGVYNHFNSTDKVENYSKIQTEVNNSFEKNKSKGQDLGASYKVFSASYSKSDAEMLKRVTSNSSLTEEDQRILRTQSNSFISPDMMNAYEKCLTLCDKSGLEPKANLPSDGKFEFISFTMVYRAKDDVERVPIMQSIDIRPLDSFECAGTLKDLSIDKSPLKEGVVYKMICQRKIIPEPYVFKDYQRTIKIAPNAIISIHTDMGDYEIRIPELYETRSEFEAGMGEIVSSILTREKFLEAYGDKWMLADGSEAPRNSQYRKYIDKYLPHMKGRLPNLCGTFLRGFNNGQKFNPEDKLLGEFQYDSFALHGHGIQWISRNEGKSIGNGKYNNVYPWLPNGYSDRPDNATSKGASEVGGAETRPKNVTVNYFIKIN